MSKRLLPCFKFKHSLVFAFGALAVGSAGYAKSDAAVFKPAAPSVQTLVLVLPQAEDKSDVTKSAKALADFMSQHAQVKIKPIIADSNAAVEALKANKAQIAFLSSRPALKAGEIANSKMHLAYVRDNYSGGHTYNAVYVVRVDSGYETKPTAQETLEQFRGKTIAFNNPSSGSGFIFPVGELAQLGFIKNRDELKNFFKNITFGGEPEYTAALRDVIKGPQKGGADVATVSEYALQPPYIDVAEAKQLKVIHKIPGVPAHGVVFRNDISDALRTDLINAFLLLNSAPYKHLLKDLNNATGIVKVDHDKHLEGLKVALKNAGIKP